MKKISILGSTGSIGKQSLEVVESLPEKLEVFGLAAGNNLDILKEQVKKFKPSVISVKTSGLALEIQKEIKGPEILYGEEGLKQIAQNTENDMILVAVSGLNGLAPTISAIENGIDIALANKETLVSAGNIVMKKAREKNVKIIPVDSEHSAIYQCINTRDASKINKIILTASGGPFRNFSKEEIKNATVQTTLAHPKWDMGDKITVDSATLMNKGLEVIEAHWLFDINYKNIEVVIHPQSIVHGGVEFQDGSFIAQMGLPSMHIPIQYALTYPETFPGLKTSTLNLTQISKLEFELPDYSRFPALKLGYEVGEMGGTYPAAMNALNEEAVLAFLEKKIRITDIFKIIKTGIEHHKNVETPSLEEILNAHREAEAFAKNCLLKFARI
jgi:1-deoxy-D-xylulose-5-phosphate reductoisomerase